MVESYSREELGGSAKATLTLEETPSYLERSSVERGATEHDVGAEWAHA